MTVPVLTQCWRTRLRSCSFRLPSIGSATHRPRLAGQHVVRTSDLHVAIGAGNKGSIAGRD
jgi:hypothetical protein